MRTSDFLKTSEGAKYLLCDGSEIPFSYSKLRSLMTHTPDLRDKVPQGAGIYSVGNIINAGLPNLKGYFGGSYRILSSAGGVFYGMSPSANAEMVTTSHSGLPHRGEYFDASRGTVKLDGSYMSQLDSPYGKSETVQPPALAVNFYIKAK